MPGLHAHSENPARNAYKILSRHVIISWTLDSKGFTYLFANVIKKSFGITNLKFLLKSTTNQYGF